MDGAALALMWRGASILVLAWLAIFFGRTLAAGRVPLIERIARVGNPDLKPALQRYTRWLTGVWTAYFLVATLVALSGLGGYVGVWVAAGSLILFVGEHAVRPHLWPGESFPGLVQQVRDTWTVWHPRKTD